MTLPASGRPGRKGFIPLSLRLVPLFLLTLPSALAADVSFSLSNDLPSLPVEVRPGIDCDEVDLSHPVSMASYFPDASVSLKSEGTPGQIASLAVDGGLSTHTALALDGAPVESLQIVPMDPGILPLEFVRAVDVYKGNMTVYGQSGMSGLVHFSTDTERPFLRLELGTLREISLTGLAVGKSGDDTWQAGLSSTISSNLYPAMPDGSIPGNLDYARAAAIASYRAKDWSLHFSATAREAGAGDNYAGNGRQDDYFGQMSFDGKSGDWVFRSDASVWRNVFSNILDGPPATNDNWSGGASALYRFRTKSLDADFTLADRADYTVSTSIGKHFVDTLTATTGCVYRLGPLSLNGNLSLPWNLEQGLHPVYGADAVFRIINGLELDAGASRQFRLPTANDLYWPNDGTAVGNPALSNEDGWEWKTSLVYVPAAFTNLPPVYFSASYRESRMENLIIWAQGANGVWTPDNTGKVFSRSGDVTLHYRDFLGSYLLSGDLSFAVNWTINDDPDSIYYGKRIEYVPLYKTALSLSFERYREWGLLLYIHHESERFVTEENNVWLPAYVAVDATVWYGIFFFSVENALNADYTSTQGYPLPGRNFRAGVDWKF